MWNMCEKAMMAEKRKLEFESLSGVCEAESADIDGVIASVSPIKKGKRASYFDCKLIDGQVQMRVVGFRDGQQKKLSSFMEKFESACVPQELSNKARSPGRRVGDCAQMVFWSRIVSEEVYCG